MGQHSTPRDDDEPAHRSTSIRPLGITTLPVFAIVIEVGTPRFPTGLGGGGSVDRPA